LSENIYTKCIFEVQLPLLKNLAPNNGKKANKSPQEIGSKGFLVFQDITWLSRYGNNHFFLKKKIKNIYQYSGVRVNKMFGLQKWGWGSRMGRNGAVV
jgi:hypothetical protein